MCGVAWSLRNKVHATSHLRFIQPIKSDSRNLLTEDGHVPPDELGVEGGVGGGLAAVEAGGEEVDVEEGHPQAHHSRAGPVQGDVL